MYAEYALAPLGIFTHDALGKKFSPVSLEIQFVYAASRLRFAHR
jgi:hypothetical protein